MCQGKSQYSLSTNFKISTNLWKSANQFFMTLALANKL